MYTFLSSCPEHIQIWPTLLYKFQPHTFMWHIMSCMVWPRSKQYTNTVHLTKKIFSLSLAGRKIGIREGIYEVWVANLRWNLPINLHFWITKVLLKMTGLHGNVVRHSLRKDAELLQRVKYPCSTRAYSREQSLQQHVCTVSNPDFLSFI